MKKIYISADIEGIWGNSNPANTAKNGYLYSEYCTNMMNEVNLVIDLLFQNGVEEVVVNDSHGNMGFQYIVDRNIVLTSGFHAYILTVVLNQPVSKAD